MTELQPDTFTRLVAPIDWPPYTPNKHSDRAVDSFMWASALLAEQDTASREIRPGVWTHTFTSNVPETITPFRARAIESIVLDPATYAWTVYYKPPLSRKWQARAKWLRLLQMSKRARKQAGRTQG